MRRDLPRDNPLDSVEVLRYEKRGKSKIKGKVPTEMKLVLEQTQQGTNYEVSVSAEGVEELKRKVKMNGEKKEALLTLRQKLEHQSDTKVFTMTMEILLEPTSNKLLVDFSMVVAVSQGQAEANATCSYSTGIYKDIMKAQIEADNQAIQTILPGLPEDIYVVIDSCKTAQEIWLCVQQMMKGNQNGYNAIQNVKNQVVQNAVQNPGVYNVINQNGLIVVLGITNHNPNGNGNVVAARGEGIVIGNNGNQIRNGNQNQIGNGNGGNQFRQYAGQNAGNQNGLIGVQGNGIQNQIGNGNLVAVRAEGNAAGHNGNQIRCYNCRGIGHFARDCTVRPRRRDAAYLQTQLLIAQKEEAGI
nr:hypothetical protein [Tanacetum cinerariifolium]